MGISFISLENANDANLKKKIKKVVDKNMKVMYYNDNSNYYCFKNSISNLIETSSQCG